MASDKHPITEEIIRLVQQSIDDNRGSKAAFCRMTGITSYNLSKILSGKKKFVFGDDWNRLCNYFPEIDDREPRLSQSTTSTANTVEDPMLAIVVDKWPFLSDANKGIIVGQVINLLNSQKGGSTSNSVTITSKCKRTDATDCNSEAI